MKWIRSKIQAIHKKVRPNEDPGRWRDLTAYWILGLCNNYGYVVMLSGAHDIIGRLNRTNKMSENHDNPKSKRMCQLLSTGAILLADIIPSFIVKALNPFFPFYINVRVSVACFAQIVGFLLVALAKIDWIIISGVALTSFSSGLGESSFLAYSYRFNKNVISTWSSGTGGAGVLGSLSYAGLISAGVSPVTTLLIMLIIPLLEGFVFWFLLRNPDKIDESDAKIEHEIPESNQENDVTDSNGLKLTLADKFRYIPSLFPFMIPLTLVYLFEYFINQGLLELVDFKDIWLNHMEQYRWLQVDYQIGVFISRSSVNLVKIQKTWLLAILQLINVAILLAEVMTFFSPSIWIVFVVVLWEGLIGGVAYVNTFYKMLKEIPENRRKFAMGIVSISDAVGISLAGAFAIPTHNALCNTPMPQRN